jgi:hypothetical protein
MKSTRSANRGGWTALTTALALAIVTFATCGVARVLMAGQKVAWSPVGNAVLYKEGEKPWIAVPRWASPLVSKLVMIFG